MVSSVLLLYFARFFISCIALSLPALSEELMNTVKVETSFDLLHVDEPLTLHENLFSAASLGDLDLLNQLLRDERVCASAEDNLALKLAVESNQLAVVERLLMVQGVDASAGDNHAFLDASALGYMDIAKRLLQEPGVKEALSLGMEVAAVNGQVAMLEYLMKVCLEVTECHPNAEDLIDFAVQGENENVIEMVKRFIDFNFIN